MLTDSTESLRPKETIHYPSRGRCMYCGSTQGKLTNEHIIPYFLLGGHIADEASCGSCQVLIHKFEEYLAKNTYYFLRHRLKFQSRSAKKKGGETDLFVTIEKNGQKQEIQIKPRQYPPVVGYMVPDRPGILREAHFAESNTSVRIKFANLSHVMPGDYVYGTVRQKSDLISELRLAAKIAHGFFYTTDMYGEFEPLLTDVILGGHHATYFVGGMPDAIPGKIEKIDATLVQFQVVELSDDPNYYYLIARIDLLISYGGPTYLAVVGRKAKPALFVYQSANSPSRPLPPRISKGSQVKLDEHIFHITALPPMQNESTEIKQIAPTTRP